MVEVTDRADTSSEVPDTSTIGSLIDALASEDRVVCREARQRLVSIGAPAVAPLADALDARDMPVRWQAVKALSEIHDPVTAPALVQALEDRASSVRWLAAEGLIALGYGGLPYLLRALIARGGSLLLRRGAHHVLRVLVQEGGIEEVRPVLEALEGVDPQTGASVAALAVLDDVTGEDMRGETDN